MKSIEILNVVNDIKQLKELKKVIDRARSILITGHINTDGDNIASQLVLCEYIERLGKKCDIVWSDPVPESFMFLPGVEKIKWVGRDKLSFDIYDTVIVVDSGDIDRTGDLAPYIKNGKYIVNIDHHKGNRYFGDLNIIVEKACSIGEILYYYFLVNKIPITYEMAYCLYVSIATDSGFFRYDCMHKEVHLIASDLLARGVIPSEVNIKVNQSKSESYFKYMTTVLNRAKLVEDGKICYSYLLKEDFDECDNLETEGLIEYLGILKSVSVYFLIKEKEKNVFTVSLRSKFEIDVALIASFYGGGGHMRAAGFKVEGSNPDVIAENVIAILREQFRLC